MPKEQPRERHTVRLIAFILMAALAIASFTIGVLQYIHRDSGFYDVEANDEALATTFDSGLHLAYYATGSSGAIRAELNEVQRFYSEILLDAYRLLDERHTYENVTNLATLNENPGVAWPIDRRLYNILQPLAEGRHPGFSLYSGALERYWEHLRYLEEPAEADPLINADSAADWAALVAAGSQPDAVQLTLTGGDQPTARLDISPAYAQALADADVEGGPLSLGVLKQAYLMELVGARLISLGYTQGYLSCDLGYGLLLGSPKPLTATAFMAQEGQLATYGSLDLQDGLAFAQFTAWPVAEGSYGYYAFTQDGTCTTLRHPFFSAEDGDIHQLLGTALLWGEPSPSQLALYTAQLNSCDTIGELKDALAAMEGISYFVTLRDGRQLSGGDQLNLLQQAEE